MRLCLCCICIILCLIFGIPVYEPKITKNIFSTAVDYAFGNESIEKDNIYEESTTINIDNSRDETAVDESASDNS